MPELNQKQRQAIEHVHGPMLVVAGAGTGKTTVLTQRVAALIRKNIARPDEILALTFTDNATAELRQRVRDELGERCSGLRAVTFHSLCYGILERCQRSFRVISKEDLWIYLRLRLHELPLNYYMPARDPGEFLVALLDFFERCHDELVDAPKYAAYIEQLRRGKRPLPRVTRSKDAEGISDQEVVARCQEISRVFHKVEEMLRADNLGTFGHMIIRAKQALDEDSALLRQERQRARFLLIDEFQDCNVAQIELARLLAGSAQNVFAVGDPDQAIYRFRGASNAAFEEFIKRFPTTNIVSLGDNQRSTSAVLNSAFAVISGNPQISAPAGQLQQAFARVPLKSAREARACTERKPIVISPVQIMVAQNHEQEADEVAECVSALRGREQSERPSSIAVLYRQNAHRDEAVKEFMARGIPLSVKGIDALDTPQVRDLLACLRAIHSESDGESLFRISALPVFNLDPDGMREAMARAGDARFVSVLENVEGGDRVLAALEEARVQVRAAKFQIATAFEFTVRRFGFASGSAPVSALRQFVHEWQKKPIVKTGKLAEFLEYMDYFPQAGGSIPLPQPESRPDAVDFMTVHGAKGLEFDHVFLLRAGLGSFPTNHREHLFEFPDALREVSLPEGNGKDVHREEERRLFYVAMTRARDTLTICARPGRGKNKMPAAFVGELMKHDFAKPCWRERQACDYVIPQIAAAAAPVSAVAGWLRLPPLRSFAGRPLSATAVEMYEECPLQFKISRDWKIPGPAAAQMQFGNAMHTTLKGYYDALLAGRPQDENLLLECFRQAMSAMHFEDELQYQLYASEGERQLRGFFAARQAEPQPDIIKTEHPFDVDLGGVRVRGRIDRLDRLEGNRVCITDYKTGVPKDQEAANESLQLSIYALAAERQKLVPERLVLYNLENNTAVQTTRNPAQLAAAMHRVQQVAAGIAEGNFAARTGYHCRWCGYRELCPQTEERCLAN
jgi:DNA helicase-2/ATP-dependent DNA helicase PcrA